MLHLPGLGWFQQQTVTFKKGKKKKGGGRKAKDAYVQANNPLNPQGKKILVV